MQPKISNKRLVLFLIFIGNIICLNEDFEDFDYLSTKNKTIVNGKNIILLKMDASKILSKNYAYFSLIITNPTKVNSFSYKFVNSEEETKDYTIKSNSGVINSGSEHTVLYKIEKNEMKFLLLKIEVSTTAQSQIIYIKSTESQTNIDLISGSIIMSAMIIPVLILFCSFYSLHKKKRSPEDIMNGPLEI